MATNLLPSCFFIQFLEQLLKFLVNFTLLKYVKSQRNYGFLITKELIFGFQILDLKDHFSASLNLNRYIFNNYIVKMTFPCLVKGITNYFKNYMPKICYNAVIKYLIAIILSVKDFNRWYFTRIFNKLATALTLLSYLTA